MMVDMGFEWLTLTIVFMVADGNLHGFDGFLNALPPFIKKTSRSFWMKPVKGIGRAGFMSLSSGCD